jgi:hypothetical protein
MFRVRTRTATSSGFNEFTVMNELRYYLETLLDHQCNSGHGDCWDCQSLQRIYQFMQTELFSTVIYNETPLEPRRTASPRRSPATIERQQAPAA